MLGIFYLLLSGHGIGVLAFFLERFVVGDAQAVGECWRGLRVGFRVDDQVGNRCLLALLGGALSAAASGVDRDCFGQALEHAPSRETVTWQNPDEDTTYQFTPTRTYEAEDQRYCREYTTVVTIGGREEAAFGTACRQPDGSWQPL